MRKARMDQHELEARLIYSLLVAGKSAKFASAKLQLLFSVELDGDGSYRAPATFGPFDVVRVHIRDNTLGTVLRQVRTGNYTKMERALRELIKAELDLATCTAEDLEKIHGIGPKTARFFLMWTRPEADHAALDTHVLKWMRYLGYPKIPKSTPPAGKKYARIEALFRIEASLRRLTPVILDAKVWDYYSSGQYKTGKWPKELQRRPGNKIQMK